MTDLRQAAQQALDDICGAKLCEVNSMSSRAEMLRLMDRAITALRTALEQQAEPVLLECVTCGTVYADGVPPQVPVQQQAEPVAYFDFQELKFSWAKPMKIGPVPVSIKVEPMKLYSESTKREWMGLTDEEILRADPRFGKSESDVNPYQILGSARDLEAKLKERNT